MDFLSEDQKIVVNFDDRLDKESIQQQQQILANILEFKKPIVFNADKLTRVDTASLQLLLSFTLTASRQGIEWSWYQPSLALKRISNLLGMDEILRLSK